MTVDVAAVGTGRCFAQSNSTWAFGSTIRYDTGIEEFVKKRFPR